MPSFSAEAVTRFEEALQKDPNSQAFAPLAEAYRQEQRFLEAQRVVSEGVRRHPQFASGWVTFAKIQRDLKKSAEALESLQKALAIAPENLLALQMTGEVQLELKKPKEALRIFKRILFLNPQAEKARRIIAKLESLTADEYDDDLFAMTKLTSLAPQSAPSAEAPENLKPVVKVEAKPGETPKGLVRMLSLIDAFIARNDLTRSSQLLDETLKEFGEHAEISQRLLVLQRRRSSQLASRDEMAAPLAPLASREQQIRQKKVQTLQNLLRRIEQLPDAPLTS